MALPHGLVLTTHPQGAGSPSPSHWLWVLGPFNHVLAQQPWLLQLN